MKTFEEPKFDVISFAAEDVVCTSGEIVNPGPPPMGGKLDASACFGG